MDKSNELTNELIIKRLNLCSNLIQRAYKSNYQSVRIYLGKLRILKLLDAMHGELSQKEIVNILGVSSPSISESIDRLERRGFIVKTKDEADQKMFKVVLTQKGRSILDKQEKEQGAELFPDTLSEDELNNFSCVLDKIINYLQDDSDMTKQEIKRMERKKQKNRDENPKPLREIPEKRIRICEHEYNHKRHD